MPARILVVDDSAAHRKLLCARLESAYYTPITASCGEEAIEILARETVDLVILDVVMPGLDGYETCRRIKADPGTQDLPVVLLTSLDEPEDRVRGAAAGADDFLTKPVADFPLFSRLRPLTRMKLASDDLRAKLGALAPSGSRLAVYDRPACVLLVHEDGDRHGLARAFVREHAIVHAVALAEALQRAPVAEIAIVDLTAEAFDPLAVCSSLRSAPATRHLPILVAAPEEDENRIAKALELGADDYLPLPLDRVEGKTRIATHLRRSRVAQALTRAVQEAAGLIHVDPLTELGNRRLFDVRLAEFVGAARRGERPFTVILIDLDHFKGVNDRHGHAAGDTVLRGVARRLAAEIRASDVACRIGGEEFAVLLDGVEGSGALATADRLRQAVGNETFLADEAVLRITISVGLAEWGPCDSADALFARADSALYAAKRGGRNRVKAAGHSAAILNHS